MMKHVFAKLADTKTSKLRLGILLLCIFIFLVHSSYIFNTFVWLDHGDIEGARALVPFNGLVTAFLQRFGETSFYRPLVSVAHLIDATLYGLWAPGFHITNILWHIAAAVAAPLFISAFFPLSVLEFFIVMIVFGVHPLSWLPVGAISYRQEIMVSVFTYLAVYLHSRTRITGSRLYGVLTLVTILLALFSKETAVFWIPAYIGIWEIYNHERNKIIIINHTAFLASEGFALALYCLLRVYAVPEIWKTQGLSVSLMQMAFARLYVVGSALAGLILPLKPALSDAVPLIPGPHAYVMLALVCIALYGTYLRKHPQLNSWNLACIMLGIALLPALNLIPLPRFNSPHYAYFAVPVVGLFAVLAMRQKKITKIVMIGLVLWLIAASIVTYSSGPRFHDDVTLFKAEVQHDPMFLEGQYYLGYYYWQHKDYKRAETYFKAAMPDDYTYVAYVDRSALYINYAGILLMQNRLKEAELYLQKSQQYSTLSMKPLIIYNLALIASKQKNYDKVARLLTQNDIRWNRAEPLLLQADALYRIGKKKEAIAVLKKNLSLFNKTQQTLVQKLIESEATK
ncbi:MAG: hypothetical protein RI947_544 [Candidatus Parcubacteria bacterium]|jgi:tetratricopeptide (TPR) repeat protein